MAIHDWIYIDPKAGLTHYVYVIGDAAFTSLFFAFLGEFSLLASALLAAAILLFFPEDVLAAAIAAVLVAEAVAEILSIIIDVGIDIVAVSFSWDETTPEGLFDLLGLRGRRIPNYLLTPVFIVYCLQLGDREPGGAGFG
jgi:hypothetical protein